MNLKDLRKNKGFSQRKVSELTGLNITHLGILEKGKLENPSIFTLKLLADVYEVNLDAMYSALIATLNGEPEELGSYLYNERKKRNLTQKELRREAGTTPKTIGRLEREGFIGTTKVTKENLAKYLGLTVEELMEKDY